MSRLEELLQGAKKVALSGHIRPDGDCVGSVMSVYQYMKKNMPEIEVKVFLETPASVFSSFFFLKYPPYVLGQKLYFSSYLFYCSHLSKKKHNFST